MKETIVKINKTKTWFFENINKIESVSHIFSDHNAETRYQSHEKNCKKHKCMGIIQHISK